MTKANDKLKEEIISEIQPKMQESFSALKEDLLNDIKEYLEKKTPIEKPDSGKPNLENVAKQVPNIDVNAVLKGITDNQTGAMDISKLTELMNASKSPPPAEMTPLQLKLHQEERMDNLLLQIIPHIFQKQQPMNSMFMELMQRNFLESVADSDIQRKLVQKMMLKKLGIGEQELKNMESALKPVHTAASGLSTTPIGTAANQGNVTNVQQ